MGDQHVSIRRQSRTMRECVVSDGDHHDNRAIGQCGHDQRCHMVENHCRIGRRLRSLRIFQKTLTH